MRATALLLLLVIAAPVAGAWPASLEAPVDGELSLRTSLLAAGALHANATGAPFGAPLVDRAGFGDELTVQYCPDNAAGTSLTAGCPGGEVTTAARLRVLGGGFVVIPEGDAPVRLDAPAGAAALGGANLTHNGVRPGAAVYAAGPVTMRANGTAFTVRPLGKDASLEVRGSEGFHTYNGTGYTLRLAGAEGAFVETRGGFLALPEGGELRVSRAPLPVAEREILLDELFALMRSVVPPEKADRRADLAQAFGPFQVVPALLNGVVAAQRNLTLDAEAQEEFLLVRVDDARLRAADERWTGGAEAAYTVRGASIALQPDARTGLPLALAIVLAVAAGFGRWLTVRGTPSKKRRRAGVFLGLLAAVGLGLLAASILAPALGVHVVLEARELSTRSLVQLLLLAGGVATLAYALVGLSAASLLRSLSAWRGHPASVLLPRLVGGLAAALLLVVADEALVAAVTRLVRL